MWELRSGSIRVYKRRIREKKVYFSDEIIQEILFRLPTRSLFRFKCVSRTWQTLISEPNFLKKFIEKTKSLPPLQTGFFYNQDKDLKFCVAGNETDCSNIEVVRGSSLDFLRRSIHVVAAHNGLVLCAKKSREGNILHYQKIDYIICNSLTKQRLNLPRSIYCHRLTHTVLYSYNKDAHVEFKVVCFISWKYNILEVDTYSSETREWVFSIIMNQESFPLNRNCLVEGSVYFWTQQSLYVYDLKEETISVGKLPQRSVQSARYTSMGESAGSLYYIESHSTCLNQWKLVSGEGWFLECGTTTLPQNLENGLDYKFLLPVALHPLHPKLVLVTLAHDEMMLGYDEKIYLYCLKKRTLKLVPNFTCNIGYCVVPFCLPAWLPCLRDTKKPQRKKAREN